MRKLLLKHDSPLPGFSITLGFTTLYLSLIVLIPLAALFLKSLSLPWERFWKITTSPQVIAAYKLTFIASLIGACINAVFGFLLAWSLARYSFWGKRIVDAMVDLPFAMPTAVSGIALAAVYSENGWVGRFLYPLGIQSAYSQVGVTIALTFIGLPFVVRATQPAIEEIEPEIEEAATSLGAGRWQIFRRVLFPALFPSLLTGFALAFARALGEYGSVIFISSNLPYKTEIAAKVIMNKLDAHDVVGATAVAVVMLLASFLLLLGINLLQWWTGRAYREAH